MKTSPPLKALLCFDAAMRLNSFSLAADELSVTPGAVGQQIRNLEQWLGGLPVSDVFFFDSLAGMPDELVEEHITLLATDVRPRLLDLGRKGC